MSDAPFWNLAQRQRAQGGYILMATITSMVVCLIIITSLVGVTLANMRIEETGRKIERQDRAAEAALNTVINQIRNDPAAAATRMPGLYAEGEAGYDNTKPPYEQAPRAPGDPGYDEALDPTKHPELLNGYCVPVDDLIEVDGVNVRVTCVNEPGPDNGPVGTPQIPTDDGAVAVRLVGGEYQGNPGIADSLTDPARNWRTALPWEAVTGLTSGAVSSQLSGAEGQLVHSAANPLEIFGGLQVRNQIAAVSDQGPGVRVHGSAAQGRNGIFPSAGSAGCGVAELDDSYGAARADVRAESFWATPGLFCGADELVNMGAGGMDPGNGDWDNARMWATYALPDRGANPAELYHDCQDYSIDGVISLPAGSYNAQQTAILNEWWSASDDDIPATAPGGTKATPCPGRTFLFEGGSYFFDVYNPDLPDSDPRKHSLVFANREINWVFGQPNGWSGVRPAVTDFPEACNRTEPSASEPGRGVDITLSARTGVHHRAGRVAICGYIQHGGTNGTAIYQRSATSLGARLLPTGLTTSSGWRGGASVADIRGLRDTRTIGVDHTVSGSCWDDGDCVPEYSFTGTGFSDGVAATSSGDSGFGSAWVDLTADGEWVNSSLAFTRFDVTLADGTTTCNKKYGPGASVTNRMADNFQTISYNLMDAEGGGDCHTVLAAPTIERQDLRGASVKVTFGLNPPKKENTTWGGWIQNPFLKAICDGLAWLGNWTGWYAMGCDNRPQYATLRVDALALRVGWTPAFDTPVSATTCTPPNICVNVTDPQNAARKDDNWATVTAAGTGSFGRLRYVLRDPTLLDGFLPVDELTFNARLKRTAGATGFVRFWLRTHTGLECHSDLISLQGGADPVTQPPIKVHPEYSDMDVVFSPSKPATCFRNGVEENHVDIGELVTAQKHIGGDATAERQSTLDVEVTVNSGTVSIDHATLSATAGKPNPTDGQPPLDYDRPDDPFTVTWNPLTPHETYNTPRDGDATFNVWGSVSVPNNDVRVLWNWKGGTDTTDKPLAAGPTGFPIFNSGNLNRNGFDCSPTRPERCRPALVASALGSWSTGDTWPADPTALQRPDPLASTGDTRPAQRRVRLTACIIDDKGTATQNDDRLSPRARAQVHVLDVDGTAPSAGASVKVEWWKVYRTGAGVDGTVAHTTPCGLPHLPNVD